MIRTVTDQEFQSAKEAWTRHGAYWRGYRHGKAIAESRPDQNHEFALEFEIKRLDTGNQVHRAFALGELRGYRQATDRP